MSEHRGFLTVTRIGRNRDPFDMYKITGRLPILNADELGQIVNIGRREMNVFGYRPLSPHDFELFMDSIDPSQRARYEKIVLPTLPGILSSYALQSHGVGNLLGHDRRAEFDIADVKGGLRAQRDIARQAIELGLPHLLPPQLRKLILR